MSLGNWNALVAEVNGRPLDGTPGVRSITAPCELFDGVEPSGSGTCSTDGHYLCTECSHMSMGAMAARGLVSMLEDGASR